MTLDDDCRKARDISRCLQLAILLEVSAEKPGNVNLTSAFAGTGVEHFLASAVAAGPSFQEAAYRGIMVTQDELGIGKVRLGELIKDAAVEVASWQRGGNTILGTLMLFMPLAVAAGMTPMKKGVVDLAVLRRNVDLTVKATSALDAVHLYEAVAVANPSGLGDAPKLDVNDPKSKQKLLNDNVSLFEVFKIGASYDDICFEWTSNYQITFELSYPYLLEQLKTKPLKLAVVHTFLKILSQRPDTFIARKVGKEKALEVTAQAKDVLELGGLDTSEGKERLKEFDTSLRVFGNFCNPGTTADLTAAALALLNLSGYRP